MKKAQVTWVEGMQFVAKAGSGHAIVLDSSESDGGTNTGTRPMELILEGLAGCTALDVIFILRRKRQKVTHLHVMAEGTRSQEYPKVYTEIHLKYIVKGRQLSEKAVQDAIELSQTKYCSVSAMLRPSVKLGYEVEIQQEESA